MASSFVKNGVDILDNNEIIEIVSKCAIDPEFSIDPNKIKVIATECVQAFVKFNWLCGHCQHPFLNDDLLNLLNEFFPDPLNYLSPVDKYIPAFARLKHVPLLCYATSLLPHFKPADSLEDCLWTIRILIIKQMVIDESSDILFEKLNENIEFLEKHLDNLTKDNKSVILGCMLACQVYLWYKHVQVASKFLQKAIDLSDLDISLEGRMGKRTKYQNESKSLLKVVLSRKCDTDKTGSCNINQSDMFTSSEPIELRLDQNGISDLPTNVNLMDDTLLTKVKYDEDIGEQYDLTLREEEEAVMCGLISYLMASVGSGDDLFKEEISAYIDYLVEHSKVWSVNWKCLYLRSLLERGKPRKLDRCIGQLEELVKGGKKETCEGCSWKLHLFYPILMEPLWKTEKLLADTLFSMGLIKSALEFYKGLDLWEEMVNCYCRLNLRDKAETIVKQQLSIKETPYLLCVLGDVTNDKDNYLKAWELSSHKSSRAQKSLGDWHFFRKEYSEAIPYYVKSLDINSINYSSWSRLAYSALETEDFALSAKAYRRVVEFDSDNFEAWNNLSKAYIKLGDKHRAFRTLQESLKCSYDNWRVWQNFLFVSIDIGAFDEVIHAWHRIIEIKGKYEDDQLLEILTNSVIADIDYKDGKKTSKLSNEVLKLLGRIAASSPGSARMWKAYAKLLINNGESIDKIVNCLIKSHQACMKQVNWEKDSTKTLEFIQNCNDLCDHYLDIYEKCDNAEQRQQFLSSFRLSLQSLLSIVKMNKNYWGEGVNSAAIESLFNHLEQQLANICSKLNILLD